MADNAGELGSSAYALPDGYVRSVLYASPLGALVLICQTCGALVSERPDLHDTWHATSQSGDCDSETAI